jgi:cbb3-type cytochrome oxidase subunit 3
MFKQLEAASWQDKITAVLLVVFALVFLFICIRVFTAKRKKMERMARLPLEDGDAEKPADPEKHHD